MKVAPFLSIIVPTFNSEVTIKKCLDSIISQSFSDFEVLIIDGISKDNTLSIVNKFNDPRIKIISESDKGIYDAMNKGITLGRGDWLYFLGSDDELYEREVLQKVYLFVERKRNYKIFYGNVLVCGDAGWAKDGTIYDGSFSFSKLLNKNICHQSVFYKNCVFKKIGFYDIKYKINADWDFNLRCIAKYKFQYINFIVAIFTAGGYGQTKTDNLFFNNYWNILCQYFIRQFYKRDFRIIIYHVFKNQLSKKHWINAIFIGLQMLFFHPTVLFSKIKERYDINHNMLPK